ncbi:Pth11-like integral membrane protein [Histoplasma ohiense]|nr:Pth11-like integral membrane protein [Histoplasma ohiense (nom. inval.)]
MHHHSDNCLPTDILLLDPGPGCGIWKLSLPTSHFLSWKCSSQCCDRCIDTSCPHSACLETSDAHLKKIFSVQFIFVRHICLCRKYYSDQIYGRARESQGCHIYPR